MRGLAGMGGFTSGVPGEEDTMSRLEDDLRIVVTWPRALLGVLALTLLAGGRGADFFLLVLLATGIFSARAVDAAASGLSLRYRFLDDHVFAGGQARLELTVTNRSRWPVPLLLLQLRLPRGVQGRLRRVVTLWPRSERRFAFGLTGLERGVYRLGDTRVVLSDWFGLGERSGDVSVRGRFVVYPALPDLPEVAAVRRLPSGPRRDPPSPFRDDLPVGVRPYHPGDPLRSIAWKASARRGNLVVREFPPVRETATWLLLDLHTSGWDPLVRHHLTETAITVAAALVWEEHHHGRSVGFGAWGALAERDVHGGDTVSAAAWIRLPPRAHQGHALTVLEVLAAIRHAEADAQEPSFVDRLREVAARLPWGSRVVTLVPRDTPELWQAASTLVARGHPVTLMVFERRLGRPSGLRSGSVPQVLEVDTHDGIRYR